jgi:hypothetical protein
MREICKRPSSDFVEIAALYFSISGNKSFCSISSFHTPIFSAIISIYVFIESGTGQKGSL